MKFKSIIMSLVAVVGLSSCITEKQYDPSRLFRPVNVQLSAEENSVTATWAGITGSIGYTVELYIGETVKVDGVNYTNRILVASEENVAGTHWTVRDLEFNKTYWFRVKANNSEANYSSRFSAFSSIKTPLENQILTVTVLDIDAGKVRFNWQGGHDVTYILLSGPAGESQLTIDDGRESGSMEVTGLPTGAYSATIYNAARAFNTFVFQIPILKDVLPGEITYDDVTLRWADASDLDRIELVNVKDANDTHSYNIGGIVSRTLVIPASTLGAFATYSATIYFADGKAGNTVRFTTKDTKPAGLIIVSTGAELKTALSSAPDGATIGLNPGVLRIEDASNVLANLNITKGVTIIAATSEVPTIQAKGFVLQNTAPISLIRFDGIIWDGAGDTGGYFIDVSASSTANIDRIEIENVKVIGLYNSIVRNDRAAGSGILNILINNCDVWHNNAKQCIIASGNGAAVAYSVQTITVTNSTFTDIGYETTNTRGFSFCGNDGMTLNISNNTFTIYSATNAFIEYRWTKSGSTNNGTLIIKDNIFYCLNHTTTLYTKSISIGTMGTTAISGNNVAVPFVKGVSGTDITDDDFWVNWGTSTENPQFVDLLHNDLTLGNKSLIDAKVGDPRWLPIE